MRRHRLIGCLVATGVFVGLTPLGVTAASAADTTPAEGTLSSGARYSVQVPEHWNGALLVWSSGYGGGASDAPVPVGQSAETTRWLLDAGYALAGMNPTTVGWAVEDYLTNQPEVVEKAAAVLGATPNATLAWGTSMGGLTTAALVERYPDTFDGGFAICASVAGGVGMLNQSLDGAFAFKTLLAPENDAIELVGLTDEASSNAAARAVLDEAQETPQGRARIALAATMADIPGWTMAGDGRPGDDDYLAQQTQQYGIFMATVFSPRQDLEALAGGAFSWNTDVDYTEIYENSEMREQIEWLYADAGLDLETDLAQLAEAPRITAEHSAVEYMLENATPTGDIDRPMLTLHETGDTFPAVTQAQAYAAAVEAEGNSDLLRQAFVERASHCSYSPAEILAGVTTLGERVATGAWPDTSPAALSERASQLADAADVDLGTTDAFVTPTIDAFHRPFYPQGWKREVSGTLPNGSGEYRGITPANWDGRLAILPNDTRLDRPELDWLRERGVATVAYSLSETWDLEGDRDNATLVHDAFTAEMGVEADTSFVAGRSQGGLTARNIVQQAPAWLDGAVAMCGGGAGAISMWNYKLDAAFALKQLIDPASAMRIVGIDDAQAEQAALQQLIDTALTSDIGAARLVFAAALTRTPAVDADGVELTDLDARIESYGRSMPFSIGAFVRPGFESVIGGNFSWNNDVDYRAMLAESGRLEEVRAAYAAAGADLEADLLTLQEAERIVADDDAVAAVEAMATFDGALTVPVVSMTTTGDAAGPIADEGAYLATVRAADAEDQLGQLIVQADGHCTFTAAEMTAAFQQLFDRMDGVDPRPLNDEDTRFVDVTPPLGLRMWDARDWGSYDASATATTPSLTLSSTQARAGDTITAALHALTASGEYVLTVGDQASSTELTVSETGEATVSFTVDRTLEPGSHVVTVSSPAGTVVATAELTVLAASDPGEDADGGDDDTGAGGADGDDDGSLAVTGGDSPVGWLVAGAALLLAGIGALRVRRGTRRS